MIIPETLKKNISETFGEKGNIWLSDLPSLIDKALKHWEMEIVKTIDNLSFNYVVLTKSPLYGLTEPITWQGTTTATIE